jgi:hypothetical protein
MSWQRGRSVRSCGQRRSCTRMRERGFDVSCGRVDAVRFERDVVDGRIVAIGERLDEENLKRALSGLA